MNKIILLSVFIILFPALLFSQQVKGGTDYVTVDSIAVTTKYKNDIFLLTKELTIPFNSETLKARAIFRWITENIRYDYQYYNKYPYKGREPKTYHCKTEKDCEAKQLIWQAKYIDKALRKKKAVCAGYSMLFEKMCTIAGLKAAVIPGYVRTKHYQVGTAGTLDHAWNAIWLDSAWHLLDATWASGGCSEDEAEKLTAWHKAFNEYYWLTSYNDFARNHYPQNGQWVMLSNYTKEKFSANPYYAPDILKELKLIQPASGIVTAKKGDTLHFILQYDGAVQDLQVNTNIFHNPDIWMIEDVGKHKHVKKLDTIAIKKQQYVPFKRDDNRCVFDYVVTDESLYYIDIVFDKRRVMRFKVNMQAASNLN